MAVRARPQSIAAIFAGYIDPVVAEYRGIRMRSTLETHFARHLDASGISWRYEPAVYDRYLPDFELRADAPTFVEVKPLLADVPVAKRRMRSILRHLPEAVLIVACAEQCRWFVSVAGGAWESWIERWAH